MPKTVSSHPKYNKVNQQKKFHLLTLLHHHHLSLKQAASQAGINYLTAKTIVFFNKKEHKSYQFDLGPKLAMKNVQKMASYSQLPKKSQVKEQAVRTRPIVKVICSTGNVLVPQREKVAMEDPFLEPNLIIKREQEEQNNSLLSKQEHKDKNIAEKNLALTRFVDFVGQRNQSLRIEENIVQSFQIATKNLLKELQQIKKHYPSQLNRNQIES